MLHLFVKQLGTLNDARKQQNTQNGSRPTGSLKPRMLSDGHNKQDSPIRLQPGVRGKAKYRRTQRLELVEGPDPMATNPPHCFAQQPPSDGSACLVIVALHYAG